MLHLGGDRVTVAVNVPHDVLGCQCALQEFADLLLVILTIAWVFKHGAEQRADQAVVRSTSAVHETVGISVCAVEASIHTRVPIPQSPLAIPAKKNPLAVRNPSCPIPVVAGPVKVLQTEINDNV